MSRSKFHDLLLLAIILLISACARQSALADQAVDLNIRLSLVPDPPVVGKGIIQLEVTDDRDQPVEGLAIDVKGDMTHAGMTPAFGMSTHDGDGRYSIPFEWAMAGDWVLQISAELEDGALLKRSFEVRVISE